MMLGALLLGTTIGGACVLAGNTTCKTNSLDWYTNSVGESPCRTYERLRQSCDSQFQVGNLQAVQPPDVCNDQLAECCCNTAAFSLVMLCLNCQYGTGSGIGDDTGYDAPAGTYGNYSGDGYCKDRTNHSVPDIAQAAICKQGIKIPSPLYEEFWGDGSWFYKFMRSKIELSINTGTNDTGLCPKPTTSATSSTGSAQATAPNSNNSDNSSGPNIGAIIGGAVGGIGLIVIAVLVWWFSRRQHHSHQIVSLDDDDEPQMLFEPFTHPVAVPTPYAPTSYSDTSTSAEHAHCGTSSDASSNPYLSNRPVKSGTIARRPPTREERRLQTLSPGVGERHEDSEALTSTFGLGRSDSGRLPPSYEQR